MSFNYQLQKALKDTPRGGSFDVVNCNLNTVRSYVSSLRQDATPGVFFRTKTINANHIRVTKSR